MTNLKKLFDVLGANMETSDQEDIFDACELIIQVQEMGSEERDTLHAAYMHGPLFEGDVPSIDALYRLVEDEFLTKVVVHGKGGCTACTYKGAVAHTLIEAMERE